MFTKIQQSPWTPWVLGFVIGLLVGLLVGQDQGRDHKGRLGKNMQEEAASQGMMMDHGQGKIKMQASSGGMMMPMSGHDMSMSGMTEALKGKTGDEFDKAFLVLMIDHHQGAVDMANEVLKSAQHVELKTFAQAIIDAQSKEITTMKQWMKDWGYDDATASSGGVGTSASANIQH
jgi:uncharacterized protein (DUF305 family)